jgi:hypothetical protein
MNARRMYETNMYRGMQIGDSLTTMFADSELSTFNFALGYSVSWNSRCVPRFFGTAPAVFLCVCQYAREYMFVLWCMHICTRALYILRSSFSVIDYSSGVLSRL